MKRAKQNEKGKRQNNTHTKYWVSSSLVFKYLQWYPRERHGLERWSNSSSSNSLERTTPKKNMLKLHVIN